MSVVITLMGGFSASLDHGPVDPSAWRRRHASSLVKLLALSPGRRLHRERVMDLLWPELSPAEAAPRLHKAAHYARRAMDDPMSLALADETVTLFPDREVRVDAVEFETAARAALSAADPALAGRAADTYAGDLLPEDPYAEWAGEARDRLRLTHLDVLRLAGRWEQLLAVEPADEQAHLALIGRMARSGDRRGALRQFERLELALRRELGVRPSREAVALRTRLLASALDANADARAEGVTSSGPLLVGATSARRSIERSLDTVAGGNGRTLFVSGPAGVGKTAMLAWAEREASRRGMRVGSGVAAQVGGAWPYAPVLEALADLSRRHPALLDGLDDELRKEIESGLSGRTVEWTARGGHQRLFVAAAELVRLAAGTGVVLVVDDADQADDASLRLLHYLARSTLSERVLLVLGHRGTSPELAQVRRSLLGRGTGLTLDLRPLPHADVRALVRTIAPEADDALVDTVYAASGGVPLFVVELARSAAAGRDLVAESLVPPSGSHEPGSLAAAAILGSTFDTDEFIEVTGLSEPDAYATLERASEQNLLLRTDAGWEFRHALIRDALLAKVPPSQLRRLHRRAADALRALHRPATRIGFHLVQAGDRAGAVPWVIEAARSSAALGAYREGLDGLAVVREAATGAELAALLSLRADLLMAEADPGTVDAYREALACVSDPVERSKLRARLARAATYAGDLDTAAVALEGLVPDGSPDDATLLLARGSLAFFQGDLDAAAEAAAEARRRVILGVPQEWQMFDLVTLQGLVAHTRGQWFERLEFEMRRGIKRPGMAARIFDSHLCVAEYLLYGPTPYPEIVSMATELRDTAERAGVLRAVAFATTLRGGAAYLMGDLELAASELREAADLHHDIGSTAGEAHSLQRLAEVELAMGNRAEANRLLIRALPLARFSSIALHIIVRVFGTIIEAAADAEAARAAVDRAEATMGVDDNCPFCSIMFAVPAAKACADAGDVHEARLHLKTAEKSVQLWKGTSWHGSLMETKARIALAEHNLDAASGFWAEAAEMFEAAGQPLDAQRCRDRSAEASQVPSLTRRRADAS